MTNQTADFRKVFSINNVLKRYKQSGFEPTRGTYRSEGQACLLGSLEHVMATRAKRVELQLDIEDDTTLNNLGVPVRILRMIEDGDVYVHGDWIESIQNKLIKSRSKSTR